MESVYHQGDDDGASSPWADHDEDYYDDYDGPEPNDIFDVEEYEDILASYTDAKSRLNAMRQARGFYPVVALIDRGSGSGSSPTRSKGKKSKGKGKSKRGKSSGGKGEGGGKQSSGVPKGARRGQAITGRQLCLRCGQAGHWAKNCPTSPDKKRKVDDVDAVMMVTEIFAMDAEDDTEEETLQVAVQDGGASSVLGSQRSIRRYLRHLLEIGYDLTTIEVFHCTNKGLRYGNSETESSNLCLLLPVVMGGKWRKILTFVIQGTAPLLFGRPLLQRLGLSVDYGNGNMRWPEQPWIDLPVGAKGEHLSQLVEDKSLLFDEAGPHEVLMPKDFETHVDVTTPVGIQAIMGDYVLIMVADGGMEPNPEPTG